MGSGLQPKDPRALHALEIGSEIFEGLGSRLERMEQAMIQMLVREVASGNSTVCCEKSFSFFKSKSSINGQFLFIFYSKLQQITGG